MGIVARQSFKASISNYAGLALGFLNLFLLFPLFFAPTELGAQRLLIEAGAVISSFALLGTHYSINRFFPHFRNEEKKHNGFFFWAFILPVFGYLLVFVAMVLFKQQILHLFVKDSILLARMYPVLLVLVLFSLFQVVLEVSNSNHGRIAVPNFLREVVLRILHIAAGFAYFKGWISFETTLWLMVSSYSVIVVFNFFYLGTLTNLSLLPDFNFIRNNPELKREALRFTAFMFLGGLTSLIVSKIDFLMISAQKSLADTAIYSIGFYLATMIDIPKRTILSIATPIISTHMKNENYAEVKKMYERISLNQLMAGVLIFYLIWVNTDNMYEIMPKGDYYKSGKNVILIMGIARLVEMVGTAASPIIANSKYYAWSLWSFAVGIPVAIIGNLILIPKYGIEGAAIATLLTAFFVQALVVGITMKKLRMHPFSSGMLKIAMLLGLFMIPTFLGNWIPNPYLDTAVRSLVLGGGLIYALYSLHVSEEFNRSVSTVLKKITGGRFQHLHLKDPDKK